MYPGRESDLPSGCSKLEIKAGDILLLLGDSEQLDDIASWLGCLPLAQRGLQVIQRQKAGLAVLIFGTAVLLASVGVLYLPIALGIAVVLMVLTGVIPMRQMYESVEWSVIVLLGSMIPIGVALESSGGTGLIAAGIVNAASGLSPAMVLVILMIVTMTLSDVMNNVATAVIAAPISLNIANSLGVNPDPFLMSVCGGGELRLPDTHRTQEQHPDHGAGRLSLWRLLAHGLAAGNPGYPDRCADDSVGVALVGGRHAADFR